MSVDGDGAQGADHVDAEMVEEAPVLGRQHRLDEVLRQFVERHGLVVLDAAPADLGAVAVLEGDREIRALEPVLVRGRLEGRLGQRERDDEADDADIYALAGEIEPKFGEPAQAQPLGSGGDAAKNAREPPPGVERRGIDQRVEREQAPTQGAIRREKVDR